MASSRTRTYFYILTALVVVAVLMVLNYRLSASVPGGVDFLTHWVGTRALFKGESPYSDAVATRVQEIVYGRPAKPGENELLDCYFLYMELVFAPFALIGDYAVSRAAWMTLLEVSSFLIFLLSQRIIDWRPKLLTLALYLVYAMLGYESVRPLVNGNVTTVVSLMLVGAIWAVKERKDAAAGLLMALAIAKPNQTIVPLLLLLLWSISVKRWRVVAWFVGATLVLGVGAMLVIRDWPLQNIANILRYTAYNPPSTLPAVLEYYLPGMGLWIGHAIAALLLLILVRTWIGCLRKGFEHLLPVLCFTIVAAQWLWISTGPGNYIMLALPTAWVLKSIEGRPSGLLWSSAVLTALFLGLWTLFLLTVDRSNGNFQSPMMFFPLPLALLIGLALRRPSTFALVLRRAA